MKQNAVFFPSCNAGQLGSDTDFSALVTTLDSEREYDAGQFHQSSPSLVDEYLGRYRIIRLLGEGAFGSVWLGYDEDLCRNVAIKVPKPERFQRSEDLDSYLAEARNVASLDHSHIVPVYDLGRTDDGSIYVVSKFIEGCTLSDKINDGHFTHEESAVLVVVIARSLHHAHTKHLIHGDVKPANILLDDETGYPYLTDFGLAVREEDSLQNRRIAGTPAYMSPEQASGRRAELDCRSDIFSLGVILYEMLTGRQPFRGSITEVLRQVATVEPVNPRELDHSIPPELERICLKSISKSACDRYASAANMADELSQWERAGRWSVV